MSQLFPDYVLSEAEDRARTRYTTPSQISPWADGVSMQAGLTPSQCSELRRLGRDPAKIDWSEGVNWMWVTVPVTKDPIPNHIDTRSCDRVVQRLACPIIRTVGERIHVLTPKGRLETVYAGGRLTPLREQKPRRAGMGR